MDIDRYLTDEAVKSAMEELRWSGEGDFDEAARVLRAAFPQIIADVLRQIAHDFDDEDFMHRAARELRRLANKVLE